MTAIKKGTLVLLQYPIVPIDEILTLFFCRCMKLKKCSLVLLVHDIKHFRIKEAFDKMETKILNTASELILHTSQMQRLLKENGVDRPSKLLWLFDYLTDEVPKRDCLQEDSHTVVFAGALQKSEFLKKLGNVQHNGILLHLYGNKPSDNAYFPEWMKYIGRFSPENITALTEEWGLIWDGDGVESLHGPLGNYLKYNSSHKVSLYIAAGIPVIVSKESALAEFVEKNKFGTSISSLLELDKRITKFDKNDYQIIRKNIDELSAMLRNGKRLGSILEDIVNDR